MGGITGRCRPQFTLWYINDSSTLFICLDFTLGIPQTPLLLLNTCTHIVFKQFYINVKLTTSLLHKRDDVNFSIISFHSTRCNVLLSQASGVFYFSVHTIFDRELVLNIMTFYVEDNYINRTHKTAFDLSLYLLRKFNGQYSNFVSNSLCPDL